MTDSNLVYDKGSIFVAPGGGGAPTPLDPGVDGQALVADSTAALGVSWQGIGTADVGGPGSSTTDNFASFADGTGKLLKDSGYDQADFMLSSGTVVSGNIPSYDGTGGQSLVDSGVAAADVVVGPASAIDNALPRYDSTTGKLLQGSSVALSDDDVMTFPAEAGIVLTASGTNPRKGTFTFVAGTTAQIITTAAVTGSVIVFTVAALGTVTVPQAILCTIDTGVGFTPVSADATDTSVVNWAIVA